MECTECKYRKQIPLKRCKHFELGGDKKRKVSILYVILPKYFMIYVYINWFNNVLFPGTNDSILGLCMKLYMLTFYVYLIRNEINLLEFV